MPKAWVGGLGFEASPGKKNVSDPQQHQQQKLGLVVHVCYPSYTGSMSRIILV
jgi:hypothetical protein